MPEKQYNNDESIPGPGTYDLQFLNTARAGRNVIIG
jgi:hypothetical protein